MSVRFTKKEKAIIKSLIDQLLIEIPEVELEGMIGLEKVLYKLENW